MSLIKNTDLDITKYSRRKPAFNPDALKYIAAFCSMIPGAILYSMNYARLDHPKKVLRILTVFGVTALLIVIGFLVPQNKYINVLIFIVNVFISIAFCNDQAEIYEDHVKNGGRKASIVVPAVLSALFIIIPFALMLFLWIFAKQ